MRFDFTPQKALFIERPNRFRVVARLVETGSFISAHCPNPGRLGELLITDAVLYVSKATNAERKTAYDLRFVEHPADGTLVSLDTRLPNEIALEAIGTNALEQFGGYSHIEREVTLRSDAGGVQSRIDFRLSNRQGDRLWIEVKSVSLVENRVALFPDAPTTRGRRHLEELSRIQLDGDRAAVLFIVQRIDADQVRPNWNTDPAFGRALKHAQSRGVHLYGCTCRLTTENVSIDRQIEVVTDCPQLSSHDHN